MSLIPAKVRAQQGKEHNDAYTRETHAEVIRLADKAIRAADGSTASVKLNYDAWNREGVRLAVNELLLAGYSVVREGGYLEIRWNHHA